jgi:catechol 2,3-dioxygenase-like lactoylglutathione lyase family enzyme
LPDKVLGTMVAPMTSHIHNITIDCQSWEPLVDFWSSALDYAEDPDNPNADGDPEGYLRSTTGGPGLLFIPVPEGKTVKNRVHLDVAPDDGTRDEEVERLLALGAVLYADHRREDGTGFVVLQDPEGNELCVERSAAERQSASTG